jgi:hypothetical protein
VGKIERPNHTHKFVPLRKGFPQKICTCGEVRGVSSLKVGQNTIDVGANGAGDVIRFTDSQVALAAGDLGMDNITGRPRAFIEGEDRLMAHVDEISGSGKRRMWGIQQNANLATLSQVGFATAPTVNTPGAAAVVHNDASGNGQFIEYATGATLNADAGWISSAFTQTQRIYRFIYDAYIKTGANIANVRFWAGMFSATPMASATPAIHAAAFRYDTGADDTAFWRIVTIDGATTNAQATTTAIATDTVYRLRIVWLTGTTTVRFLINGVDVGSSTTNLPTTTQNLGHVEQVRALAAANKIIRVGGIWVSQNAGP